MKKDFIVMRHSYDDHSYIDGKNDTSLTENGIEIAKTAAIKVAEEIEGKNVIIRHSVKKRALETAEILCDYLLKKGFNCECVNEPGLTELFQGKFDFSKLTHEERVLFLQSCWDDFEDCRMNGDYRHNFGQNKDRSIILTPGANHIDWSLKIADGLLSTISDMEKDYQSIAIAHRGAIYMIEQLVRYANGAIPLEEIEKYHTRWMNYCQDYKVEINDLDNAKKLIKEYKSIRGAK